MDGWMDGWVSGWVEGWMDGRTNGWIFSSYFTEGRKCSDYNVQSINAVQQKSRFFARNLQNG